MKLSEVAKLWGGVDYVSVSNIDDIFAHARSSGIDEVEIDTSEMLKVVRLMLYTAGNSNNPESWNVLKTGVVDEYLGVKLKLV